MILPPQIEQKDVGGQLFRHFPGQARQSNLQGLARLITLCLNFMLQLIPEQTKSNDFGSSTYRDIEQETRKHSQRSKEEAE